MALELGIWDVRGMMRDMSWEQAQEWMAFAALEPFGAIRADLRSGIVASVIANTQRDPDKSQPFKPTDFMPYWEERKVKSKPTINTPEGWSAFIGSAGDHMGMGSATTTALDENSRHRAAQSTVEFWRSKDAARKRHGTASND